MGVITFDKVPSTRFGIEVASPPRYIIPEEDYTQTHILGLSGDRLTRWDSYKNTTAKYVCTFLAGEQEKVLFGDVNGDGVVTAADAALLLRILAGLEPGYYDNLTIEKLLAADVNQNGALDEEDASLILQSVVRLVDLPSIEFGSSVYDKIANRISQWLHPYYSPKEKDILRKKRLISGKFETDKDGYFRLEDTYMPSFYRRAFCKESITVDNIWDEGGVFELPFICVPGKYYKIGEEWLDASSNERPSYTVPVQGVGEVTLPALHYWDNNNADGYAGGQCYVLGNLSKYVSRPIIRMFFDSSTFNSNTRPNVCQISFKSDRGIVNEFVQLRINMQNVDYSKPFVVYVDFDTCNAYAITEFTGADDTRVTKARLDSAQADDNQLTYFAKTANFVSWNNRVTTQYPLTRDTGILYSGVNKIFISFWGGGRLYYFRNFEILPRWWTL